LFDEMDSQTQNEANYKRLEYLLKEYLKTPRTNKEVYSYFLHHEFLPKHAINIFNDWQQNCANFEVLLIDNSKPARKGSFYVRWEYCKPQIPDKVKLFLRH